METRRSARIRGRAAPSPRSANPVPAGPAGLPPVAAVQELPLQAPKLELDLPLAAEEDSLLEAVGRLPAFGEALFRAHRSLKTAAQAVASLERALVKPLEPVWDVLAIAAGCHSGAPVRLGPDITANSLDLPALEKLASALGLETTGNEPDLVARLGPVVGERGQLGHCYVQFAEILLILLLPGINAAAVPAGVHIGIASAMRPGFALALAARADIAALRADASPELEARIYMSQAMKTYCLADQNLKVSLTHFKNGFIELTVGSSTASG